MFFTYVVTCFNSAPTLYRCLDSIRGQTFQDFEVLIIDNASSDETIKIAHSFVRQDARFILVKHPKNLGSNASYNEGFSLARGLFVMSLDSDDWQDKEAAEKAFAAIQKTQCDLLLLRKIQVDASTDDAEIETDDAFQKVYAGRKQIREYVTSCLPATHNGFAIRRSLISSEDIFSGHPVGADTMFIRRLLLKCNKLVYEPLACWYYWFHSDSASNCRKSIEERTCISLDMLYRNKQLCLLDTMAHGNANYLFSGVDFSDFHFSFLRSVWNETDHTSRRECRLLSRWFWNHRNLVFPLSPKRRGIKRRIGRFLLINCYFWGRPFRALFT